MGLKKFLNATISFVIISAILSGSCFASTSKNVSIVNKIGNLLGNIVNEGLMAKQGDSLLYTL